jgi:alanyl-tRNA synthetase
VNSDEIRTAFLRFFEDKGHKVIPSSSLIPKGDPTLLLTTAGMVQVKPYFLGKEVPPAPRLASCQKCFRTTDIEEVGDATHCTFFEMLGNFSVGDYFKKEAIVWAWEFVTEWLKLPPEKLWVTIYLDDDEAYKYWRETGIPEYKILRFGEEDNFWGPAGSSGPCGPCSEIHYDFGEEVGCGRPDCKPNCECGRFSEIWNLVFTQYDQAEDGSRRPLPKPNIDTGMGMERITAAVGNMPSIYETDLFAALVDRVSGLTGKKYGVKKEDDTAIRVVAEHGRAITFLIADGVMPDNEGRGYVLRRLLRRAALFGLRLGLDEPFLAEIARTTITQMGHVYLELRTRQDFVTRIIDMEEARFDETLKTGLEIIEDVLAKKGEISGDDAFKLYDTYGFPIELTREIARERGIGIDMEGFEREMEKQRERARAAHRFDAKKGGTEGLSLLDIKSTEFVGYHFLEQEAKIVRLMVDGKEVDKVEAGQKASLVLDVSPFYGEMGGQVGDTGEIAGDAGRFTVTDTVRVPPDITVHQGKVTEGTIASGKMVRAIVDMERRRDIARNHTATHLLQSALRQVLGEHIQQRGSLVAPERLRFNFSHLAAMKPEEIKEVQRLVNEKIRHNLRVYDEESSYQEAVRAGAIALFDEKYGDTVRVMKIGEPTVSAELCGGTHVDFTGEIGYFHIISEGSIGAGLRRIEAVTGRGAESFIEQRLGEIEEIARSLDTTPENAGNKVADLISELDKEQKRIVSIEKNLARNEAESLLAKVENVNGVNVLAARVTSANQQILREMADLIRNKQKSVVVVLGTISGDRPIFIAAVTPDLVKKGYHAGDIVKQVAKVAGGGGGGKADFAQAGGRDKGRIDEALGLVKNIVQTGGKQ